METKVSTFSVFITSQDSKNWQITTHLNKKMKASGSKLKQKPEYRHCNKKLACNQAFLRAAVATFLPGECWNSPVHAHDTPASLAAAAVCVRMAVAIASPLYHPTTS